MNTAQTVAHSLLAIKAVFLRPNEPFTWASGIKSPIYTDNRLVLTAPAQRNLIEEALAERIRTHFPEAEVLMGTATAGIAHAALAADRLGFPWDTCDPLLRITAVPTGLKANSNQVRRSWLLKT